MASQPSPPPPPGRADPWSERFIVVTLGLTVLGTGLDMTLLQLWGRETPAALVNLGSVAIGALAMMLPPMRR